VLALEGEGHDEHATATLSWDDGLARVENRLSRGSLDSRRAPFGGFRTPQESCHSASRNQ